MAALNPTSEKLPSSIFSFSRATDLLKEARCGQLAFNIVTVNMVAAAIFAGNLALGGALVGALSLSAAVVILPSIALFGPSNYFYYLPQPLFMGLGFAVAWASVKVGETGAWSGVFSDWAHFNDYRLAEALPDFFKENNIVSIMDCGCGTGFYVNQLRSKGFDEAQGCDGNPGTKEPCIVADLSKPDFLANTKMSGRTFDCVMSLEVAEHLPPEHEQAFLDNLTGIAKENGCIILSWAKKGQGGLGHVNEQNEDYVLEKMSTRGWTFQQEASDRLRLQTSPNTFWFRNTIYVFRKSN